MVKGLLVACECVVVVVGEGVVLPGAWWAWADLFHHRYRNCVFHVFITYNIISAALSHTMQLLHCSVTLPGCGVMTRPGPSSKP